jgi:hypothetical protein
LAQGLGQLAPIAYCSCVEALTIEVESIFATSAAAPDMKLKEHLHRLRFQWVVKGVLNTPPLQRAAHGFTALSMVQHQDVLPYLLAIKSLARFVPPSAVVVVADPTLTVADRQLIARHVPGIEFREAAEFRCEGVPTGGTWERLLAIAEYVQRGYVVQVDADIVALSSPLEVTSALDREVSFTLGTMNEQKIETCEAAARHWYGRLGSKPHVQSLAEATLDKFDPDGHFRYVRGCSGFAGFAPKSIDRQRIAVVSTRMAELVGPRWADWGSEQFTSNLLVSSSPGAQVLPHPKYCAPHYRQPESVLLHFIGFVRYTTGQYAATAARVVSQLA